jgi:hypothetical protein
MSSNAPVILGTDVATGNKVLLQQDERLKGLYVIGKTGSGKTTLLVNMILQDIEAGRGLCFFDTHGDAITDILRRLPSQRENDVILLDLVDKQYTFGLNIFQCVDPTDDEEVSALNSAIMSIFAKLFTESGDMFKEAPTLAETLQDSIPVFLAHTNPRMTMAEIPLLLTDETARKKLLTPVKNLLVAQFWRSYERLKHDMQEKQTESTRRRISNFLIDPLAVKIVGQSETTIPFRRIMDESKILLVKLSRRHELITNLIGSMMVAQIAQAAYSRIDTPEDQRVPFYLYADEYQRFCTPTFAELLAEVRKYKIATCVAHQFRDQLDKANRGATLNAANMVVYQVSGEDAEELAKQFHAIPAPAETRREAILAPKQDVLGHLEHQGHTSKQVSEFAAEYLPKLRYAAQQQIDKSPMGMRITQLDYVRYPHVAFPEGDYYAFDPDEVRKHLITLNTYFYGVITGKAQQIYYDDPIETNAMIKALAPVLGFPHYYLGHTEPQTAKGRNAIKQLHELNATKEEIVERVKQKPWDQWTEKEMQQRSIYIATQKKNREEAETELHKEAGLRVAEELEYQGMYNLPIGEKIEVFGNRLFAYRYERGNFTKNDIYDYLANDIIRRERRRFLEFHHKLFDTIIELMMNPIMVESGSYEEKPVAQRTVADVEKEVAKLLTNPSKPFTARAKLGTKEYVIQALPFRQPDPQYIVTTRHNRIVDNTRRLYCKKRDDVDKEIEKRQAELTHWEPPQRKTKGEETI